jgi:two-component system response regulator FixJ
MLMQAGTRATQGTQRAPRDDIDSLLFAGTEYNHRTPMAAPVVFLVGDDPAVCDSMTALVESAGLQAETFRSLRSLLDTVPPGRRGCVVVDADSSALSRREQQINLAALCATMPVISIIAHGDIPMAVRGLKAGALEVVERPYRDKQLVDSIHKALEAIAAASR